MREGWEWDVRAVCASVESAPMGYGFAFGMLRYGSSKIRGFVSNAGRCSPSTTVLYGTPPPCTMPSRFPNALSQSYSTIVVWVHVWIACCLNGITFNVAA